MSEHEQAPVPASVEPSAPPPSALAPRLLGARRAFWIFLVYLAIQLAVGLLAGICAGVMIAVMYGAKPAHDVTILAQRLVIIPAGALGLVAASFVVLGMARKSFTGVTPGAAFAPIGWRPASTHDVVAGALVGILLVLLYLIAVSRFFPPPPPEKWGPVVRAIMGGGWPLMLWAVIAIVLAPPIEEFVFRGLLFEGFRRSWGASPAAIVVTLLFLSLHITEAGAYPPALVSIAALGVLTVVARLRTQSLAPGIALHVSYNVGIVLAAIAESGANA